MNFVYCILASALLANCIYSQPLLKFTAAAPAPEQQRDPAFEAMNILCNQSIPLHNNLTQITGPIKHVQTSNGADIAYIRFGNASSTKNPLVYINGFGDTMKTAPFDLLLTLAENREVVLFDLPDQGLSMSADPTQRMTITTMANDTASFIETLNLSSKPDAIGFSMGGFIGLSLLYPPLNESINNLIIASSSAGGRNASQLTPAATLRLLNATKTQYEVSNDSYNFANEQQRKAACSRYGTYLSFYDDPENKTTTSRQFRAISERDASTGDWAIASVTDTPIWLIAGSLDEMVPPEDSHDLASVVSNVWLTMLPDQKHAAFASDPAWFVDVYDAFTSVWQ